MSASDHFPNRPRRSKKTGSRTVPKVYYARRQGAAILILLAAVILILAFSGAFNRDIDPALADPAESASTTQPPADELQNVTSTTVSTEPPTLVETAVNSEVDKNLVLPDTAQIDVTPILQLPELPTGCEITSLTMLLNYLGYDVDKTTIADNFLPISTQGGVSFDEYFVGSPYIDTSFGCFAPVIVKTAKAYLESVQADRLIVNLTDSPPEALYANVAQGSPVIVWCTMGMTEPTPRVYWNLPDGTPETFYTCEHCVLLTGYDKTKGLVTVCDPLKGLHQYSMAKFELRYSQLESQAIIIR